jgi:hypothetical protein
MLDPDRQSLEVHDDFAQYAVMLWLGHIRHYDMSLSRRYC